MQQLREALCTSSKLIAVLRDSNNSVDGGEIDAITSKSHKDELGSASTGASVPEAPPSPAPRVEDSTVWIALFWRAGQLEFVPEHVGMWLVATCSLVLFLLSTACSVAFKDPANPSHNSLHSARPPSRRHIIHSPSHHILLN